MMECVARQAILDTKLRIYGYELLYRSSIPTVNAFTLCDPDQATSSVLANSMFLFGMDKLTNGKPAFVNFSPRMLVSDIMTFLPNKDIAVEVLETVEPDALCLAACERLKAAGYKIVLDDFTYQPQMDPLIAIADIIKVDFVSSPASFCEAVPQQFRGREDIVFLAEKVETHEQYQQALSWGYTLFQGFFFCKPLVLNSKDIHGNKLVYFKLLKELNDPAADPKHLEEIIQRDTSLSYKILRFMNSSAFGLREKISSLQQAVAMLGTKKLLKFVTLVLLKDLGMDKPSELTTSSVIRGRFAERIAEASGFGIRAGDAFLTGLFSLLDALLDRPMSKILEELPLSEDISGALRRRPSRLTSILETVIAYEQGNWDTYDVYRQTINLSNDTARKFYLEAVNWTWDLER